MKICVFNLGNACDCFVSSTINRGLLRKYGNTDILWVVAGEEQRSIFEYTKGVKAILVGDFLKQSEKFDLLINLSPNVHPADPSLNASSFSGFNFDENSSEFYEILYGRRKTSMNLFQVYFRLAGLTWRGEGYGVTYYPRNKAKDNCAAIAIDHAKLRHYVNDHLAVDTLRFQLIPYKKNIFKRMDEINRSSIVVTDDHLTTHLAIYLRKYVHFLETIPLNTQPEFFGQGQIYKVDHKIVI